MGCDHFETMEKEKKPLNIIALLITIYVSY
jgi:hypothetical protein